VLDLMIPGVDGVEVCRRIADGQELVLLLNHTASPQEIGLPRRMRNLLDERAAAAGEITLPAYEVAVMR
jgi:CheY-like chemotaxis protein